MSEYTQDSLNDIWENVLEKIKTNKIFDETVFSSYIKNSVLKDINDDHCIIEVNWSVNRDFFLSNISEFENCLTQILNKKIKCDILVKGNKPISKNSDYSNESFKIKFGNKIFDKYTFDNFIQGQSNMQSFAAAEGCALSNNNSFFNPLFIYGNSGLGKTHLLHAICNYIKDNRPGVKYLYVDGNDLIYELIEATKTRKINQLVDEISKIDYVLIDDIQHLAKTGNMQDLFFNLYNKLIENNKQIVLTSDVYPSDLKNINKRIISRFTSGLSVSITSPEFDTAVSILHKKLEGRNRDINITEDAIYYIAHKFNEDVRKLEGALNELLFKAVLFNPNQIDEDFVKETFKENPIVNTSNELNPKTIKKEVCNYYNISIKQIESKSRTADIANARHIAVYLCREMLDLPFKQIGTAFGGRDHSTIMSSYDKMSKLVKDSKLYKDAIDEIKKRLGN